MNRINYKKTFLLGFGFFAISVTWSVYNAFMPKILSNYISSAALIGFIMTIDNYFAVFVQPTVGMMSDRIDTRFGKRMPFIMVGMPLATVFIILLANQKSFLTLIVFIVLMNLSMSIFRSPVISLMPDITHKENRSKANSIINFMGGVGAVIAYFVGSILWNKDIKYPFYLSATLMLLSFIVLFNFIKEKRDVIGYESSKEKKVELISGIKASGNVKNVLFLLLTICSYFIAYAGIEAFFTLYGENYLKVSTSTASISFTFISISFLIFAIPAGIIGTKIGKKKTISMGILGLICCFLVIAFIKNINFIRGIFVICGFFWALININSYPFVTDMAPKGQTGIYTGLYYLFSSVANIVSPPLLGSVIDIFGYRYMFIYGVIFFAIAFVLINSIGLTQEQNMKVDMKS
ncbi:MAG: SLC45 family MFS transporter [Caloramator sp.]|nr:SLC45 family MFS transporter [Caloramator sp.]